MARTPLAGAVQDAVARSRPRGAAHHAHALRQGGRRRSARPDRARPLRRARTGRGCAEDRRRRRRPGRAERGVLAEERRLQRRDPRGLRPDRRPLLDAARRLRRRPDRRARRRADRPEPHRRSASSPRGSGSSSTTCSRPSRTAPSCSATSTAPPTTTPRCRRHQGRVAEDPLRRLGGELSDHVRDLDGAGPAARQHVDRRLDQRDLRRRDRVTRRPAPRRRLQHRVRRRVHRAELAQPALPARLLAARASSASSARRTRSTTSPAATTRSPTGSRPARRADHDRLGARRSAPELVRHVHAHLRAGVRARRR